jgi:hypothetical protein
MPSLICTHDHVLLGCKPLVDWSIPNLGRCGHHAGSQRLTTINSSAPPLHLWNIPVTVPVAPFPPGEPSMVAITLLVCTTDVTTRVRQMSPCTHNPPGDVLVPAWRIVGNRDGCKVVHRQLLLWAAFRKGKTCFCIRHLLDGGTREMCTTPLQRPLGPTCTSTSSESTTATACADFLAHTSSQASNTRYRQLLQGYLQVPERSHHSSGSQPASCPVVDLPVPAA